MDVYLIIKSEYEGGPWVSAVIDAYTNPVKAEEIVKDLEDANEDSNIGYFVQQIAVKE